MFVMTMVLSGTVFAASVPADQLEHRSVTIGSTTMPYRLFVPPTYNSSSKYPIVVFLHGKGEIGTDNELQLKNNGNGSMYFIDTTNQAAYPMFYIAPQAAYTWRETTHLDLLKKAIQELSVEFNLDMDRIYLTGISMGGYGTWRFLSQDPEYFAAGIPMSYGSGTADKLIHQPIWAFHAANDTVVSVGSTDNAVKRVRDLGGSITYTRFDLGGHGIWSTAYKNPLLLQWMMAQRRGVRNATKPLLTIEQPVNADSMEIAQSPLSISGTANLGTYEITGVEWKNLYNGTKGAATGTSNWSKTGIQIFPDANNLIQITATGTSFVASWGGKTTFNDCINVTLNAGLVPYTLTVNSGNGDGQYEAGISVTVTADAAPAGKEFDSWTGDIANLASPSSASTTLIMPAANVTISASYRTTNQAPVVNAGLDQNITLPAATSLQGSVTDDGLPSGTISYQWSLVSGPGAVSFSAPTTLSTVANFASAGSYVIRLTANDGEKSTSDDITVTVNPQPVIYYTLAVNNGNGDGQYEAGISVTVTADAAPSGKEFDSWTGDIANLASHSSASTTLIMPAANVTISASYRTTNHAPVVNAGLDQIITLPAAASLQGVVTDDGLPSGTLSYQWSLVSGPDAVIFSDATALSTTVGFAAEGSYILCLTANDGVLSSSDNVIITVDPEPLPAILVDFGNDAYISSDNWNNLTAGDRLADSYLDLIDSEGVSTNVRLTVTDSFAGANTSGTTAVNELGLPASASRDSLIGNDMLFGGQLEPTAGFKLEGLSPDMLYTLTFYASRMNVTDNRETQYTVGGETAEILYLDASNNISNTVTTSGIRPDSNGEINVAIQKGPNNNNSFGFYYIGAVIIEAEPAQ